MKYNKKLLLDIDGVLNDFVGAVHLTLKQESLIHQDMEPPIIRQWDINQAYPSVSKEAFNEAIWSLNGQLDVFLKNSKPYPGAIDFVRRLPEDMCIWLVSSKNKAGVEATWQWLYRYFGYELHRFSAIHFTRFDLGQDSKAFMVGPATCLLLDDKPTNCTDFLRAGGRKALLFNQPWNEGKAMKTYDIDDVNIKYLNRHRVKGYDEALDRILGWYYKKEA